MRKLIESILVSLTGVIESREGWARFEDEANQPGVERSSRKLGVTDGRGLRNGSAVLTYVPSGPTDEILVAVPFEKSNDQLEPRRPERR